MFRDTENYNGGLSFSFLRLRKPKVEFEAEVGSQSMAKNIKANIWCAPNNLCKFPNISGGDIRMKQRKGPCSHGWYSKQTTNENIH